MKVKTLFAGLLLIAVAAMYSGCAQPQQKAESPAVASTCIDRQVLTNKAPLLQSPTELDVRNATIPEWFGVKPRKEHPT
jgi:hypothetical protein